MSDVKLRAEIHELRAMLKTLLTYTWVALDESKPDKFTSLYELYLSELRVELGNDPAQRQMDLAASRAQTDYPEMLDEAVAYQMKHPDEIQVGDDGIFYVKGRAFNAYDGD